MILSYFDSQSLANDLHH